MSKKEISIIKKEPSNLQGINNQIRSFINNNNQIQERIEILEKEVQKLKNENNFFRTFYSRLIKDIKTIAE